MGMLLVIMMQANVVCQAVIYRITVGKFQARIKLTKELFVKYTEYAITNYSNNIF